MSYFVVKTGIALGVEQGSLDGIEPLIYTLDGSSEEEIVQKVFHNFLLILLAAKSNLGEKGWDDDTVEKFEALKQKYLK